MLLRVPQVGQLCWNPRVPSCALQNSFAPHLQQPSTPSSPSAFCSIYFNPSGGKPGIRGSSVAVDPGEHPADWFEGLPRKAYAARIYTVGTNKYKVRIPLPNAGLNGRWAGVAGMMPVGWIRGS